MGTKDVAQGEELAVKVHKAELRPHCPHTLGMEAHAYDLAPARRRWADPNSSLARQVELG